MKQEVLRLEDVTYKKGNTIVFRNMMLNIMSGEIMGLITINSYGLEELLDVIEEKAFPVTLAEPGLSYTLGDAVVSVIAPVKDYGEELNNWSVGIRLVFGRNSFVFTGDAQEEAERDMVENKAMLRADVWKAAHHGSDTSNSAAMLDAVSPSFAVISCGNNNSYGHPNASVLEAFRQRGIQVFRTDEQGTVIAWSDGTNITWSCEPYGL